MPPIVEIRELTKKYGHFTAVSGLSMAVEPGEILALLGPNGAGKTTTIKMLMGILRATSGEAFVAGKDCFRDRAEVMRSVGYLPDDPVFYDYLRGSEILGFVGEMHGLSPREAQNRAAPLIKRFDLTGDLNEYAVNYSKGMKKKLAMICALLHEPRVLILDEPTNGLDPFATRELHALIRELAASGTAVFFSTHLLDQAERLCHRVGILYKSRLVALGPLEQLRSEELTEGGSLEDLFFRVASDAPREEES
jgi:ABC-2 type transport system ATP-binding protein